MKANKKTLMAVKRYLELQEGYDIEEVVDELVHEVNLLHVKSMGDITLATDECEIIWDTDTVCVLDEFVSAYTDAFIKRICNIIDSFVGEELEECDD